MMRILMVLAVVLALGTSASGQPTKDDFAHARVRDVTASLDGDRISLKTFASPVDTPSVATLVVFWMSSCPPCNRAAIQWAHQTEWVGLRVVVVTFAESASLLGQLRALDLGVPLGSIRDDFPEIETYPSYGVVVGGKLQAWLEPPGNIGEALIAAGVSRRPPVGVRENGIDDGSPKAATVGEATLASLRLDEPLSVIGGGAGVSSRAQAVRLSELRAPADQRAKLTLAITWSASCGAPCDTTVRRWSRVGNPLYKHGLRLVVLDVEPAPVDAAEGAARARTLRRLGVKLPMLQVASQDATRRSNTCLVAGDHIVVRLSTAAEEASLLGDRAPDVVGVPPSLLAAVRKALAPPGLARGNRITGPTLVPVGTQDAALTARKIVAERQARALLLVGVGQCGIHCVDEARQLQHIADRHPELVVMAWEPAFGGQTVSWTATGSRVPLVIDSAGAADSLEYLAETTSLAIGADGTIVWRGDFHSEVGAMVAELAALGVILTSDDFPTSF